jgi:dienelactone hydrolase
VWSREISPPEPYGDLRAFHFEFSSRGDRVPGRLLLPPAPRGDGPFPAVLLQHGARGSREAPYLDGTGGPWARKGAAVISVDFPLHGARSSAKLTELLLGGVLDRSGSSRAAHALVGEFVHQAVADLGRALDAASALPGVDPGRAVYAGFSLGAMLGATFCALDPRPRAAALAVGGGGLGPPGLDPVDFVGRVAPRPLLFVNAERDETIPRAAAEAFFDAAGDPKEHLWFDGTHAELPGLALKAMWEFLRPHLEIPPQA